MNSARFKVAEHLLEVRLPDTLITTDIIPSFSPFVCEEEGKDIFSGKPSKQRVVFAISY